MHSSHGGLTGKQNPGSGAVVLQPNQMAHSRSENTAIKDWEQSASQDVEETRKMPTKIKAVHVAQH